MAGDSVELCSYPVAFGPGWSAGRLIPSLLFPKNGVVVLPSW